MKKLNELIELYNKGLSLREIGKTTDISYEKVRYHLIKCGVHKPKSEHIDDNDNVICLKCNKSKHISEFARYKICSLRLCIDCEREKLKFYDLKKLKCTVEEYEQLLEDQKGECKICSSKIGHVSCNGKNARLAIDHCHKTGKIRGLLCGKCNMGLGLLEDYLEQALVYINTHK